MATKGTAEIEQQMYEALEDLITGTISGGFYESDCRPVNSKQEDAVLTATYASPSQIQVGRAKLNIYVSDIDNGSGGAVPNKTRLQELSRIGDAVIETLNQADTDYLFYLSQATHTMADQGTNQHFVNINIGFKLSPFKP